MLGPPQHLKLAFALQAPALGLAGHQILLFGQGALGLSFPLVSQTLKAVVQFLRFLVIEAVAHDP